MPLQAEDGGRVAPPAAGLGPRLLHRPADGPRDPARGQGALQGLLRPEHRVQGGQGPDRDRRADHPHRHRAAGAHPPLQDPVRQGPQQRAQGQPGGQLGGGLRHPDGRDEDVRAGVPEEEDGGRGGGRGLQRGPRARREQLDAVLRQVADQRALQQVGGQQGQGQERDRGQDGPGGHAGRGGEGGGDLHRPLLPPHHLEVQP